MAIFDPILTPCNALQPRAVGGANVRVRGDDTGATHLADLRQSGSLKLVFPRTQRAGIEAVIVNTAGGITGGDRFDLSARADSGATLTLTTQAAERAYRAQPDETGHVRTNLSVADGARINWLPQELILFENSRLERRLEINLEGNAQLLMVEPLVFGRAAMDEQLRDVWVRDRIAITRDGLPVYIDGMDLTGDVAAHLNRPAMGNGAGAMASLVMVSPNAASSMNTVRGLLPEAAGASMIAEDIMVMRILAIDSFELRRSLIPVLEHLSNNTLPTSWRL